MLSCETRISIGRRLRGASLALLSLVAMSCLLLVTSTANATKSGSSKVSLEDLVNGGELFSSGNGGIKFTNFAVEITGADTDISDYQLKGKFSGFKIYGNSTGVSDEAINIRLSYDVEVTRVNRVMTAVGLSSYKWNKYGGNAASIEVFNSELESIASGMRLEDKKDFDREYYDFSEYVTTASVQEEFVIDRSVKSKKWKLKRRFKVKNVPPTANVPEPNTALMLGLGMAGIATYARRRR